jgi:hypothetical protein
MNKYILKVFIFCVAEQKIYTRVCVIRTRYTHSSRKKTGTGTTVAHGNTGTGTFRNNTQHCVSTHITILHSSIYILL